MANLPKAVAAQEWFPLIVLETVRSLRHRPIGRKRLAQLLNGSQAKAMQQFGYNRHKFYGKLNLLSQPQITTLIDALISARYLRLIGGNLPVLSLSPLGEQALEARAALPIRIPGLANKDNTVDRWQARSDRSDTIMQSFNLLNQGLTPTQIAAKRNLKESTIYTHLARLISNSHIKLHQVVPHEIEAQVLKAIETVGSAGCLTPNKTILPDAISFDQIKCVIAAHPELSQESQASETLENSQPRSSKSISPPIPQPSHSPALQHPPAAIILEAVVKLGGTLGRTGLAQFLTGSQAGWLETFVEHAYYGELSHLSQKAAINIIDALIADGKLLTTRSHRPKVILPDQSPHSNPTKPPTAPATAEQRPAEISADSPAEPDETSSRSTDRPVASTEVSSQPGPRPGPNLLDTLRVWRTKQARSQGKPPYIIFANKVLEAIAQRHPTTLEELGEIPGIGPAKLAQHGPAIITMATEALGGTEPQAKSPVLSLSTPSRENTAARGQIKEPVGLQYEDILADTVTASGTEDKRLTPAEPS